MPKLRSLTCSIQWADTGTAFQEYQTCYGDGVVETYIVVPDRPQPFTIHLTSQRFIHEGLAVLVFVDGQYQTNRIRVNLVPAKKGVPRERTEVDLTIRQKEKALGDGMYMGRAWRFDDHNIVPTLPAGVTDNHFIDLGSIEVFVLRCSFRNIDETNESTTSSAAQSDICEALEHELESESIKDDATEKKHSAKPSKANAKVAKEDDDDEALQFAGLFDGPSDYGRAPYPPPDHEPGHWSWPSHHHAYAQQASYGPRYDRPPGSHGNAPYPDPGHSYDRAPHSNSEQYQRPAPARHHPPRSEKRVHFDYGRDQGPAADHARYWDAHEEPGPYPRPSPYSSDKYYTPGLSEWYGDHSWQYNQVPRHGSAPHAYNMQGGDYATYGRHHNGPPQPEYPPYQYAMHGGPPPPSPGAYARWAGARPAPPWSTQPMQGAPQAGSPRYYHPQAPHYQPYAGMPYPNAAGAKPDSGQSAHGQAPDGFAKLGSLDPAKDENNVNDTNQTGSGGGQDQWKTDNKNNSNSNSGNVDQWGTNNGNQTNGDWANTTTNNDDAENNNNETTNGNDPNDGTGSHKSEDWSVSNKGDQSGGSGWKDSNNDQNNNTQNTWDNTNNTAQNDWNKSNNNTSNTAGGGDSWANDTSKASATVPQASGSGIRPLYGPYGAYYAMQFASASAPEIACDAEEEPRYDVPQPYVDDTGSVKQVQPGKGYLYYKKQCHPEYIDRLEEPYAKFVFRYRTKDQIEKELSINVDTQPSGNPEVQTLQNMAKDDLIQMLIRAKGALGGEIPPPPPASKNPTEEAFVKGVPIDPPRQVFLDYDIPLRGGNGGGGSQGATLAAKGGNEDWAASNNSNNNATNESWDTKPTDNNNGNAAGGDWGSGANSQADPKQQFPKESWAAAQKQQKSGPPPAPPARPEPQSNTATGDSWEAAPSNAAEANASATQW